MSRVAKEKVEIAPSGALVAVLNEIAQSRENEINSWNQASADFKAAEKFLKGMLIKERFELITDIITIIWNPDEKRIQVLQHGDRSSIPINAIECPLAIRMLAHANLIKFLQVIKGGSSE